MLHVCTSLTHLLTCAQITHMVHITNILAHYCHMVYKINSCRCGRNAAIHCNTSQIMVFRISVILNRLKILNSALFIFITTYLIINSSQNCLTDFEIRSICPTFHLHFDLEHTGLILFLISEIKFEKSVINRTFEAALESMMINNQYIT